MTRKTSPEHMELLCKAFFYHLKAMSVKSSPLVLPDIAYRRMSQWTSQTQSSPSNPSLTPAASPQTLTGFVAGFSKTSSTSVTARHKHRHITPAMPSWYQLLFALQLLFLNPDLPVNRDNHTGPSNSLSPEPQYTEWSLPVISGFHIIFL